MFSGAAEAIGMTHISYDSITDSLQVHIAFSISPYAGSVDTVKGECKMLVPLV